MKIRCANVGCKDLAVTQVAAAAVTQRVVLNDDLEGHQMCIEWKRSGVRLASANFSVLCSLRVELHHGCFVEFQQRSLFVWRLQPDTDETLADQASAAYVVVPRFVVCETALMPNVATAWALRGLLAPSL